MRAFVLTIIVLVSAALLLTPFAVLRAEPPRAARATPPGGATASAPAGPVTTRPALLDVGDPAPAIHASAWLNGAAVAVQERGSTPIYVITFWATWSGPCRAALPDLIGLHERYHSHGVVFVGVSDESAEAVRSFLVAFKPEIPFVLALDNRGATTHAYCEAAGVGFLPYAFVVGPDRTLAWHGHPQQPELATILDQLLAGHYDRAAAKELVRRSRSVDQLESLFRDAYANEAWQTALLALDALLQTDVPKQRLLRYKLSILLGEFDDDDPARTLARELCQQYASDSRFLNSLAWDVVSQPRLYLRDPGLGLDLARAAYHACAGQDAAVADTYARALHLVGRVDLAVKVQERAVTLSSPEQRERNEQMLSFYRRCAALQKDATADP